MHLGSHNIALKAWRIPGLQPVQRGWVLVAMEHARSSWMGSLNTRSEGKEEGTKLTIAFPWTSLYLGCWKVELSTLMDSLPSTNPPQKCLHRLAQG